MRALPKTAGQSVNQSLTLATKDFADAGWVIQASELELRESIGKGEFGDVLLGLYRGNKVNNTLSLAQLAALEKSLSAPQPSYGIHKRDVPTVLGGFWTTKASM